MTRIKTLLRQEWELTVAGVILGLFFLPTHIPNAFWAITRMAWWIPFLLYVNEVNRVYKSRKKPTEFKSVWYPSTSAWVNRWGVSWRTLTIVIPTMLITFFFVMLAVFA